MENKKKVAIAIGIIGLVIISICIYNLRLYIINGEFKGEDYKGIDTKDYNNIRYLSWEVKETIKYSYEECKNINRDKPIKRLFRRDYTLPMCPDAYVVLYDEYQKIVFKFNQDYEKTENPTILTVSTSCDNFSGEC